MRKDHGRQQERMAVMTWPERFARAREPKTRPLWAFSRGLVGFNETERGLAESWETCAVGEARHVRGFNLDVKSPGTGGAAPRDPVLNTLGREFYYAVCRNDVAAAEDLYAQIQERAARVSATSQADTLLREIAERCAD